MEKKASRETVTLTTTDRETTSGSSEIFRDTDTDEKDKSVIKKNRNVLGSKKWFLPFIALPTHVKKINQQSRFGP